ncbi:hypothetical protein OSB04_025353 [Centaurea solstitialis]|uniref:Uncharacterized protein n=1 Tax=Centaurea solstitialis TaxID=347529 RepID=A0AA38WEQ6_9ASTR|nr:hypothetical protein OSB04_025353 [Centaurea solstitialis]
MVTPPLITSFMKFIVIQIHVLPRENFNLLSLYLKEKYRLTSLILSRYNPFPAEPLSPQSVHRDKILAPTISHQHNIGHRKDLGDPPKHEIQELLENGFLFEQCMVAWIRSH